MKTSGEASAPRIRRHTDQMISPPKPLDRRHELSEGRATFGGRARAHDPDFGPLRGPAMRVPDRFMKMLRQGLVASGLPVTADADADYMVGRHPC